MREESTVSGDPDRADGRLEVLRREGTARFHVRSTLLRPFLVPGDEASVARCDIGALRRGDLVLVGRAGVWTVRLVTDLGPLRTAFLRGDAELETGEVVGRVVAMRRVGGTRRVGPLLRGALRLAHTAGRSRAYRWMRQRSPRSVLLRLTSGRRARTIGPVLIRRLGAGDAELLDAFAQEHLPKARRLLARQIAGRWRTEGIPLGAFSADGRLLGFAFVDEYRQEGFDLPGHWLRTLAVSPAARRTGIGARLIHEACARAASEGIPEVYADIRETNRASLRLFRACGFRDAPQELVEQANRVLTWPPGARLLVVYRPTSTPA
jgi:L-amino acid N-acyltransferase YncA